MTRTAFDTELEQLHIDLIKMGALIEDAIAKTIRALQQRDYTLARETADNDRAINDMEKSIESRALSLILRQQPVARDLRSISTALKVVTDMERIGDQCADIAEIILRHSNEELVKSGHISQMAEVAKQMVNRSVTAFTNSDISLAKDTSASDDVMDDLFNTAKDEIVSSLRRSGADTDSCVDALMIIKYLERIGDHAVNICEWTEFCATGSIGNDKIL